MAGASWRLPDAILTPKGDYQPQNDEVLKKVCWLRTLVGVLFTAALFLVYSGNLQSVVQRFLVNTDGCDSFCDTNTFWGSWLTGVFVAIWISLGVILVLAIVLGLIAEPGYRWVTLRRLWRPVIAIAGGCLLLYLSAGAVVVISLIIPQGPAYDPVMVVVLLAVGVYIVKILHLAASGLFRADDVHPLLAPLAAVPIALSAAIIMFEHGGDGGEHIPLPTFVLAFFGAAITTALSVWTWHRLAKNNPRYPFRIGPTRRGVAPGPPHAMPGAVLAILVVATLLAIPAATAWGEAALPVYRSLMADYRSATQSGPIRGSAAVMPSIVTSVATSPNSRTLAVGTVDGFVYLRKFTETGQTAAQSSFVGTAHASGPAPGSPLGNGEGGPEVFSVSFSADSRTLATAVNGGVYLWNVTDPSHPAPYPRPLISGTDNDKAVAFAPRGHILAIAGNDGTIRLWDASNPARPILAGQHAADGSVLALAFAPDGRTLATASASISLWNITVPSRVALAGQVPVGKDVIHSLAFSPDGKTIAAGTITPVTGDKADGLPLPIRLPNGSNVPTVRLWNVSARARPTPLGLPLLAGGTDPNASNGPGTSVAVFSVAFAPDGRTLVGGTDGNLVYRWDSTNPTRPFSLGAPLSGPRDWVTSVAFTPDGQTLIAGSSDGSLWLWATPALRAGH